jgi:hypothetical protein
MASSPPRAPPTRSAGSDLGPPPPWLTLARRSGTSRAVTAMLPECAVSRGKGPGWQKGLSVVRRDQDLVKQLLLLHFLGRRLQYSGASRDIGKGGVRDFSTIGNCVQCESADAEEAGHSSGRDALDHMLKERRLGGGERYDWSYVWPWMLSLAGQPPEWKPLGIAVPPSLGERCRVTRLLTDRPRNRLADSTC